MPQAPSVGPLPRTVEALTMNAPKPGARPTPGAMPGAGRRVTARPSGRPGSTDPGRFGRIDDTGAVWVRTSDGERKVGEWQAGTPSEGLAHFARRFDDLLADVQLLEARLASHPEEADRLAADARAVRESLSTAAVVGDLDSLAAGLDEFISRADATAERNTVDEQVRRESAAQRKEELVAEVTALGTGDNPDWKAAGDRIHTVLDEWKSLPRTDSATDDALWDRFRDARDGFHERRSAHFAELDRNRDRVRRVKEDLVARAEALQDSTDWAETSRAYRDLMAEWKAAGRARRADDDRLWERFRTAQDRFFGARDADRAEKDAEFEENARIRQALLDEYSPRIDPATGLDRARALLRELQDRWDATGFVPRDRIAEFDGKIAEIEARVSDYVDRQWRATDPEALARVGQFRRKAEEFAADADAAEKAGKTARAAELRTQADQWSEWADAAAAAVSD